LRCTKLKRCQSVPARAPENSMQNHPSLLRPRRQWLIPRPRKQRHGYKDNTVSMLLIVSKTSETSTCCYLKLIIVKLFLMLGPFRNCWPNAPLTGPTGSSCPGSIPFVDAPTRRTCLHLATRTRLKQRKNAFWSRSRVRQTVTNHLQELGDATIRLLWRLLGPHLRVVNLA